jgi:hypothetical protein
MKCFSFWYSHIFNGKNEDHTKKEILKNCFIKLIPNENTEENAQENCFYQY